MSVFHFKRFDVANEASSMKVNTDGVLLGAAVTLRSTDRRVLDVGTGTGTIALMLAQRYSDLMAGEQRAFDCLRITGIDIDGPSAAEAANNFFRSPWALSLKAECCALSDFMPEEKLDLIVSNPPYFEDSLLPPEARRSLARHTAGCALSYEDLVRFSGENLEEDGRAALILPSDREQALLRYAASFGFHASRILRIRTTPRKPPSRIVVELSRVLEQDSFEDCLTIQDLRTYPHNKNGYTPEYRLLTGDFLKIFD